MQGETKVFEGQRRTLARLVIGLQGIFPFSGLKGQEKQLTWVSVCRSAPESNTPLVFEYVLPQSWLYFSFKPVFAGNFTADVGFLFYLVCSLVMWHNVQIKKISFGDLATCLTLMAFFTLLPNTGLRSSSVEGQSWGWDLWGGCISFQNYEKHLILWKNPQTPWEAQRLSFQNWTASVHFSWKIFKESPDFECWCLQSPVKENTPPLNFFKHWILYIFEYSYFGELLTTMTFLCPGRNYEPFFSTSIAQNPVKHFLTAFVNNISRFIPRSGICLAMG